MRVPGNLLLVTAGFLHQLPLAAEDTLDYHLVPAQNDGVGEDGRKHDTNAAQTPDLQGRHLVAVRGLIDDTVVNVDKEEECRHE